MENCFETVRQACRQLDAASDDQVVSGLSAWLEDAMSAQQPPTLALVSTERRIGELLGVAERLCGLPLDTDCLPGQDQPLLVTLRYGEETGLRFEEDLDTLIPAVTYSLPSEYLKGKNLALCSGIPADCWLSLSAKLDALCLVLNATMALTAPERNWLTGVALPLFGADSVFLGLEKLDRLNSKKERGELLAGLELACQRLGLPAPVGVSCEIAAACITAGWSEASVRHARETRICRNVLTAVKARLETLIQASQLSAESICATKKALMGKKKTLSLAADYAADCIVANTLSELKAKVIDGVEPYHAEIVRNIRTKLESTPDAAFPTVVDKVPGYIEGAWRHYLTETDRRFDETLETLYTQLTQQIEKDADELLSSMTEENIAVLYDAFGLQTESDLVDEFKAGSKKAACDSSSEVRERYFQMQEKVQRETRNLMLLSVPLLFFKPLYSVGVIIGANVLQKYKIREQLTEQKALFLADLERLCDDYRLQVLHGIISSVESMTKSSAEGIRQAYASVVTGINSRMEALELSLAGSEARQSFWMLQAEQEIPELLASLE